MPNYKDFKKQYNDYIKEVSRIFQQSAPPIMKEAHKKAILMEVYYRYEPTQYGDFRRYGDNGLLDESNFDIEIDINKNTITITLYNETKGNQYMPNNQSSMFVDEIIVSGEGYSWKNSNIAKHHMERDFYRMTEEIMNSEEVRDKIIKEFNKNGLIVW
jgi:hypothetical protein